MDKPRLLIAVPHNSGTTYLVNLIANYINPDIKYLHAADDTMAVIVFYQNIS